MSSHILSSIWSTVYSGAYSCTVLRRVHLYRSLARTIVPFSGAYNCTVLRRVLFLDLSSFSCFPRSVFLYYWRFLSVCPFVYNLSLALFYGQVVLVFCSLSFIPTSSSPSGQRGGSGSDLGKKIGLRSGSKKTRSGSDP